MNTHSHKLSEKTKRIIAITLIVVLGVSSVGAGLIITQGTGVTSNETNVITYVGNSGVLPTTLDGLLAFTPNGITAPTTSGASLIGSPAITYPGLLNILATGVDSGTTGHASGLGFTSPNGSLIH